MVRAKDSHGNPVLIAGTSVTFTAPASGASGTFANATNITTTTTNSSGVATATVFTANNTVLTIAQLTDKTTGAHRYINWPRERFCWFKDERV